MANSRASNESSRALLGRTRRALVRYAIERHRPDLAAPFQVPSGERTRHLRAMQECLAVLPMVEAARPAITDAVECWLTERVAAALRGCDIRTLADLVIRVVRRRRWWSDVPGLGQVSAKKVGTFLEAWPELREYVATFNRDEPCEIVPWERLCVPAELNGENGTFRSPQASCVLNASKDYEAVQAWLITHESAATQRAYRKEAERLILWAVIERKRPLSSLATEDALAYREFLRRPGPQVRWVGPSRPRESAEWRPFTGDLSNRSVSYAFSVIRALFRWLMEHRYLMANPFAGVKVRGVKRKAPFDTKKAFSQSEWEVLWFLSEQLETAHGWSSAAAQRLRFVLNFCYATGLRVGEFIHGHLGDIAADAQGHLWLEVVGKGSTAARVALPPLATNALNEYLMHRGLPTTRSKWNPATPILGRLQADHASGLSAGRVWTVIRRFFSLAAELVDPEAPATAAKLRAASPHWMRHTHATHALQRGVELSVVRDNLRHASIATTSTYVHADDSRRAVQIDAAFETRPRSSGRCADANECRTVMATVTVS